MSPNRSLVFYFLSLLMLTLNPVAHSKTYLGSPTKLIAQSDPDEAFDPFSDYSEYDEASDEEADIDFLHNGKQFTVGLLGGNRGFTDNFDRTYSSGPAFGVMINFNFDFRNSLAISFLTGDHAVHFDTTANSYSGNVSFTNISFDYKYHFNPQNITRGLANFNPYWLAGFSQFYRTYNIDNVSGISGVSRDAVMGFDLGGGIEIPIARKKAFIGLQGVYHIVTFPDENKEFLDGTERLIHKINGNIWDAIIILGINP